MALDQPVEEILPEFAELQVLEPDGRLRPPASKATIRQLMTHTAGLGYFFFDEGLLSYYANHGLPHPLSGKKAALHAPLIGDPGTRWDYGVSFDWLGLAVEQISGQSLGAYLADHVWGPLGMTDSTFSPNDEQRTRLMPVRLRAADGPLIPTDLDLPREFEWEAGGHGSYGTARDYGRFIRGWLGDGQLDDVRILKPETVDLALQDHLGGVPMPDCMRTSVPELSNDVPSAPFPQSWGLGFQITGIDLSGMRSAGSGDWAGLFNTYFWIDRTVGVGGALMTQVLPFYDARIVESLLTFEAGVYAQVGSVVAPN
jgi:methyl acetate hydrolase